MTAENKNTDNEGGKLVLTERFTGAIDYARKIHTERRKGTDVPYMAHLLGVASLVMGEVGYVSFPVTEEMIIAALLHDTAEDHGGLLRLKDIEHNFGSNVARVVAALSDSLMEDSHNKPPWQERKQAYIQKLRNEPFDVQLISAADKLYNAKAILEDYRVIGPRVWERFKRGREDQLWYFDELIKVFKLSGVNRIVSELEHVVNELRQLSAREELS